MDYSVDLKEYLNKKGMQQSFSAGNSFPHLSEPNDIYIDTVLHKTFLEMDEEGTLAAAVTLLG